MGRLIEFFISGDEVWCQTEDGMERLEESNTDLIEEAFSAIHQNYPDAYNALEEWYAKSMTNLSYFKFLCVQRFCKCNFGVLDTTKEDIDVNFRFHFERIPCPLRGECKHEGVICMPKYNSKLTNSQMRVMRLFYEGKRINEIAEELFLSPNTVREHRREVYAKLGIHSNVEFVKYANDNKLFNT